ncbi:VOC family protein [Alphaproteobacteria bacterium]|nr:VOC family protein [Alphaproteobacteria bacterium]
MSSILRRTTYLVKDIERSVSFYQDGIGLNLLWRTESKLTGLMPIGSPGDLAKFAAFNGEDPMIGMVAFIQLMKSNMQNNNSFSDKLSIGNSILVLGVDDCDYIYSKIRKMGVRIYKAPFDNLVNGRDGNTIKMRSMFAWDPDNIFLEINQRV